MIESESRPKSQTPLTAATLLRLVFSTVACSVTISTRHIHPEITHRSMATFFGSKSNPPLPDYSRCSWWFSNSCSPSRMNVPIVWLPELNSVPNNSQFRPFLRRVCFFQLSGNFRHWCGIHFEQRMNGIQHHHHARKA